MNTTSDKREFERLPVDFVLEVFAQDIDGKGFRDAGVLNDVSGEGAKFLTRNIDQTLKVQSVQLLKYAEDLARYYEKLKKEEKVRDRLSRYVEKSLVEKMIRGEEEPPLKMNGRTLRFCSRIFDRSPGWSKAWTLKMLCLYSTSFLISWWILFFETMGCWTNSSSTLGRWPSNSYRFDTARIIVFNGVYEF